MNPAPAPDTPARLASDDSVPPRAAARLRMGIVLALLAVMAVELAALIWQGAWASSVWAWARSLAATQSAACSHR